MAINNKPIFIKDDIVSSGTLTATSEDSDFPADYIGDERLGTWWKGGGSGTMYVSVDYGASVSADSLLIAGHNLYTADADVSLEYRDSASLAAWNAETPAGGYSGDFWGIAYGAGLYVAVGASGEIQTSPDGATWTARTADASYSGTFWRVRFVNNIFIAVGSGGAIQTSSDGITWTARTADASFVDDFFDIAYGNGVYIIVGDGGEIQSSSDASTWSQETPDASYSGDFHGAQYNNSLFIIVGTSGEIQTSSDGSTWSQETAAGAYSGTFYTVTYGAGLYVAMGSSGEIQTSPDGSTWTARTAGGSYSGNFFDVVYATGIFVAVGNTGGTPMSQTSTDGITWSVDPSSPGYFGAVGYNPAFSQFAAVGISGAIKTSLVAWTELVAAFTPTSDGAFYKEWTSQSAQYWRLKIVTASVTPYIAIWMLGLELEMQTYLQDGFNPTPEKINAELSQAHGGAFIGAVLNPTDLEFKLDFQPLFTDTWIINTFDPVWVSHFRKIRPVGLVWDKTGHPTEVHVVVLDPSSSKQAPFGRSRRTLTLNLKGVVE